MLRVQVMFLLGAVYLLGMASPVTAASFADYVAPPYAGEIVMPDFDGAQRAERMFRTGIRSSIDEKGINFAGRWNITGIGCGTGCQHVRATDLATGSIIALPVVGGHSLDLDFERNSRLIKARWVRVDSSDWKCTAMMSEFVLEDDEFVHLGTWPLAELEECY